MHVVQHLQVHGAAHHVLPDPLHLVDVRLAELPGLEHRVIDRADRVGADVLDARVLLLEELADAAHGAAGADAGHEDVDAPARLLPELRRRHLVVRLDVVGVVVLVQVEAVGRLGGDAAGHRVVALGRLGRHVGGGDDDLRPERLERVLLLLRHLVRHGEDAPVALHRRRQRHAHPGVAGGVLDDGGPLAQQAGALRLLDDVERHAVLDGAAGVQELELGEHGGVARADHLAEADQRGVADRGEDVLVVAHGGSVREERTL
jgi:hypothetical protein